MKANNLYVACIDLSEKRCLVVGAGPIALEKIEGLLAADANVSVVAPCAIDQVRNLADAGIIDLSLRGYATTDLSGCFLVVAATSDTGVNTRIHADGEARSMLVNVADVPHLCNFMLPAIVREGPLAVAISTAGASPALAKRMKREAADMFGAPYAELADILESVRPWAKEHLPTYMDRKAFFEDVVNGAPDPIGLIAAGHTEQVWALIEAKKQEHAPARRGAPSTIR